MTGQALEHGLVAARHRSIITLYSDESEVQCLCPPGLAPPVAGDRVRWRPSAAREGVIAEVLERANVLARPTRRGETRIIAANVDRLLVMNAAEPASSRRSLDRSLALAEHLDIPPLLVFNKVDLVGGDGAAAHREMLDEYRALGYPAYEISVKSGAGLGELSEALHGKTTALVGQSGVGKSSLTDRFCPGRHIKTDRLTAKGAAGRHTTSAATLYRSADGAYLIDSPGTRDFGLWHVPPQEVARAFVEFRPHLGACRFRDCTHVNEPGCAIARAAAAGEILASRWESYRAFIEGL